MKKRIVVFIIIFLFIIIGLISYVFWNNRTVSVITLDINPSIEIKLTRNKKVKSVAALNEDAKNVVDDNLRGKTLDYVLNSITNNLVDNGYVDDNFVEIILYSNGNIENDKIESKIKDSFDKKQISTNVIIIESVTKEDEELDKKYHTTPAKISYIKSIEQDNKNISVKDFVTKSVSELKETKTTGRYCDIGYTLEGDWCIKEIKKVLASTGEICPTGYLEYDGKCYEEMGSKETDKLLCRDEFNLEGDECIRRISVFANVSSYTCSTGEVRTKAEVGKAPYGSGDANDPVCVDPSSKTHPVTPCQLPASDPTERLSAGGKCYWHRAPVIAEGCPGKVQVDGFCWDEAVNVYLCPNGNNSNQRDKDDYCYTVLNNVNPIPSGYKCDDGMTLDGNRCVKEEREQATHERTCPSGYTLVNNDRCINYNNTAKKENGLVCSYENSKLKNNMCIIYEKVGAKHN